MKPAWASRSGGKRPRWAEHSQLAQKKRAASTARLLEARREARRAWQPGTLRATLEDAALPSWWVEMLMKASVAARRKAVLLGVEIFAGKAQLSSAFCRLAGPMETFEIENSPRENILNSDGVLYLMQLLLRIQVKGLTWLGTPCKSWVCLSKSWTRRSVLQPAGPPSGYTSAAQAAYLAEHNCIADLCSLIIRTVAALGIDFIVEQPMSSLLFTYPAIRDALRDCGNIGISFMMAAYCGESPKPLLLKGSPEYLRTFAAVAKARLSRTTKPTRRLVHKQGKFFTGNRAELQQSSGYTRCMGASMALAFLGKTEAEILEYLASQFGP